MPDLIDFRIAWLTAQAAKQRKEREARQVALYCYPSLSPTARDVLGLADSGSQV